MSNPIIQSVLRDPVRLRDERG